MSEQAGEFNQLAGIVAQITEREGVTQRMCRDRHPLQVGAPGEAGDNSLDRAHRHCRISATDEQRCILVLA